MQTLAPTFVYRHTRIRISTERSTEFIDLTEGLEALVAEAALEVGFVNVQTLHTTTGIVVNEHEPLLLDDFTRVLDSVAARDSAYHHDDASVRSVNVTPGERPNGHAHCQALLLGATVCLNVVNGRLLLGRWQRVFLVELDGPRPREISVLMMGEARQ
jgi:secondary thiamine-phosphate synthase enzyme